MTIDERALFEALRAEGHAVEMVGDVCGWAGRCCAVLAWNRVPATVIHVDVDGEIGQAHSIADVVRLLAPYRPQTEVAESVAVTVAESAPDFLDEMIAEGGAGYAERVDAAQARRDADAGDDDFAWGIDLFDEDPMGDAIEARGVALVAEAKAAVDAGRYREPRRVASAKDDADVLARAFEAIGDGTEVAKRLAAGDYDATGWTISQGAVKAVFDREVPGMGRVVGKPLDHVRGAVRVGEMWLPTTAVHGWWDGVSSDIGATQGLWVGSRLGAPVFEPGITAEDFARRYGAAMGGER